MALTAHWICQNIWLYPVQVLLNFGFEGLVGLLSTIYLPCWTAIDYLLSTISTTGLPSIKCQDSKPNNQIGLQTYLVVGNNTSISFKHNCQSLTSYSKSQPSQEVGVQVYMECLASYTTKNASFNRWVNLDQKCKFQQVNEPGTPLVEYHIPRCQSW
jgi:hypothetical protein